MAERYVKTGWGNKVDGGYLITTYMMDVMRQALKLPHEVFDEKEGKWVGTTYEDIEKSYCNGVDVLYHFILGMMRGKDETALIAAVNEASKDKTKVERANQILKAIVRFLEMSNKLNANTAVVMLDEDEDGNIYDPSTALSGGATEP